MLECMTEKTRALLEEAKKLSEQKRESLAYEILQTLGADDAQFSPKWCAEIERRVGRVLSGEAKGIPMKKAIQMLRRSLADRRRNSSG